MLISQRPINNIDYKFKGVVVKQLELLIENRMLKLSQRPKNISEHIIYADNMESEIYYGDMVQVDEDCETVNEKDIFMFQTYDEDNIFSRCKVINNNIRLIPSNKNCNNIDYKQDEILLIGKVINYGI